MKAIEFAKEFIENLQSSPFDINKETFFVFNKEILKDDPDLKILNAELSKIGYILEPTESSQRWTLKKLN